jgi:hypothetical protein
VQHERGGERALGLDEVWGDAAAHGQADHVRAVDLKLVEDPHGVGDHVRLA